MIEKMAIWASPFLGFPLIRRIRRNHGLEHATIHMLTRRVKNLSMAGRADNSGFYLYGDVDTDLIWEAATEALERMRGGEHRLAVHPNCGTGLVTTSLMTSSAAVLGLVGTKNSVTDIFNRLPLVMLLSIFALIVSQPVGLSIQRHFTTFGDPGDLEIVDINRKEGFVPLAGKMMIHRVNTRYG
jgi:hypothetical protein